MSFDNLMNDNITVHKIDGGQKGPYKASVQGDKIIMIGSDFDGEEGDKIIRELPNGKEEVSYIVEITFINARHLSNYTVRTRKNPLVRETVPKPQVININSNGIQIGDYNTQNIVGVFQQLIKDIDNSNATHEEKEEAKNILKTFIEHPLTTSIMGSGVGGLIGLLG